MEKYIYDDHNGLWYELQGDYYIPCLVLDEADSQPIGVWGRKHRDYLAEHRSAFYATLVLEGRLYSYLAEVDHRATDMLDRLMKQMTAQEGVTEQLKAQDQMAWVRAMNSIRNRAEEVINAEVIFA